MRFKHEDAEERPMPERKPVPYGDVVYDNCPVRQTTVAHVDPHYRTTIKGYLVHEQVYSLGLYPDDYACEHRITGLDRFGYGRCFLCHGHFWSMRWVADGVFGDSTLEWAIRTKLSYDRRLVPEDYSPLVDLITGGVHQTRESLRAAALAEIELDV